MMRHNQINHPIMNHIPLSVSPIIDDDRDCLLADNSRQPHLHSGRRLQEIQPFYWQVS